MNILAHRGSWTDLKDRNSLFSLSKALENGFGIETDVRDHNGELVISHDIPTEDHILLDHFLSKYNEITNHLSRKPFLALNIKADGLCSKLKKSIETFKIDNYFVFDMSFPDTLHYLNEGLKVFLRQSEFEELPLNVTEYDGIWLDQFKSDWFENDLVLGHLVKGKKVCIVSPELHSRDYLMQWNNLKTDKILSEQSPENNSFMLCTDFPFEARRYFDAK